MTEESNPFLDSNIDLYDSLRLLDKESLIKWFIKRDWLHKAMVRNGINKFSEPWANSLRFLKDALTNDVVERHILIENEWKEYHVEMFEFGEKNNVNL